MPVGRRALNFLGMYFFIWVSGTSLEMTLSTGRWVEAWCLEVEFNALEK
jgi:hypothetical protein